MYVHMYMSPLLRTQRGACAALGPPSATTHEDILRQAYDICHRDADVTNVCPGNNLVKNDVLMMFDAFVCDL